MTSTKDDFDRGVETLVIVLLSVGAHSWAVAPSFSRIKIAAMHYSRIQNVTPADSRDVRLWGRVAARGEGETGEVQAAAFPASGIWPGGPPVLSTRCL